MDGVQLSDPLAYGKMKKVTKLLNFLPQRVVNIFGSKPIFSNSLFGIGLVKGASSLLQA